MKTKTVFCAKEQKETEHTVTIDTNGEFVFECACGSFLKLPSDFKTKDITKHLELHKVHNEGQVTIEQLEKENEKKLALLDEA